MPPVNIPAPTFPLEPGETLWRLDSGDTVTISVRQIQDSDYVVLEVSGRYLDAAGVQKLRQTPFDAVPGPVWIPTTRHSIQFAALAGGQTTVGQEVARVTAAALVQWAAHFAALTAIMTIPVATPRPART